MGDKEVCVASYQADTTVSPLCLFDHSVEQDKYTQNNKVKKAEVVLSESSGLAGILTVAGCLVAQFVQILQPTGCYLSFQRWVECRLFMRSEPNCRAADCHTIPAISTPNHFPIANGRRF
eukprot:5620596-Amphidinium_carterae.1